MLRGPASPIVCGAVNTHTSLISPSACNDRTSPAPASTNTVDAPVRSPAGSVAHCVRSEASSARSPSTARTSTPHSRSMLACELRSASASGVHATTVGVSRAVRTNARSTPILRRGSHTTRTGVRDARASRTVSRGSSVSTVPIPVRMASTRPRSRCTIARLSGPLIQRGSPGFVAIRPSADCAHLAITHGRPVRTR